jgi:nucleoside-diphosphate-sugar epimerase
MKKVVITGANGGIGYALTKKLCNKYNVLALDNKITRDFPCNVNVVKCDLANDYIGEYISDADYIFHLACIKPSDRGTTKEEYKINLKMTENIAKSNNNAKVIYASAGTIYGSQSDFPIKECCDVKCNVSDYYCRGKLESEHVLDKYSIKNKWPLLKLRITNVYGPDFARKGEILPEFYNNIKSNKNVIVYGTGEQKRDRIFIKDLVDAFYLSIKNDSIGIINIGSGESFSTIEIANIIGNILDKKPKFQFKEEIGLSRIDNLLDISLAKKELNFNPKFNLKKGIKEVIKKWNS